MGKLDFTTHQGNSESLLAQVPFQDRTRRVREGPSTEHAAAVVLLLDLGRIDYLDQISGTSLQTRIACEQPAVQQSCQCNVLGIVRLGPAKLFRHLPSLEMKISGGVSLDGRFAQSS